MPVRSGDSMQGAMTSQYDNEFEQRAEIAARLKALEEAVKRITPAHGGIGHNRPPTEDDDEGSPQQDTSKPINPAILNTKQAADYVGLSPSTLAKLRLSGDGPVFVKMMSRVGYQLPFLDEWLAQRQRTSTSEVIE